MTTSKPFTSPTEKLEDDALLAGEAAAGALRAVEIALVVLIGLLVCPPLAILVVLVVVPLARDRARPRAPRRGRLDAVPARPPLPRAPCDHLSLLGHRLRHAGRALIDLPPHRIVADARNADPDR